MSLTRARIALNAIQWINVKADLSDPDSADLWLYREPSFRAQYPGVLAQIKQAGFDAVMMEVLDTQTLQNYAAMVRDSGLTLAPGYCSIALPEDHGMRLSPGSPAWVRWFDPVRRKAEESNYFGLSSVFLAPEVSWEPGQLRTLEAAAVGAGFDQGRLDRVVEVIAEAAEVLHAEGVTAGLHNHVGTWVETRHEIDHVLANVDADLLKASFDVGHLAWAGIDAGELIDAYADRILDLHVKDLDLDIAARSRTSPTSYKKTADLRFFLEPGLGQLDLTGILRRLPDDFDGWVIIEVDRASMPPEESAQKSWAWVEANVA